MTTMVENPKSASVPVLIPEADRETLAALLASARPENTRKTYAAQWSAFTAYCRAHGLQAMPADAETVAGYIAYLLRTGASKSRINVARSAILAVHADGGEVDHSRMLGQHHGLWLAMRGVSQHFKAQRVTTNKAKAFTREQVIECSRACPETPQGRQDRAVFLLGVNLGMRASELVRLLLSDLTEVEQGMDVYIPYSKTSDEGYTLALAALPPRLSDVDAVRAVRAWVDVLEDLGEAQPDKTLVRRVHRGGMRVYSDAVSEQAISDLVRRVAGRCGIETDGFSGHSLRSTMVTLNFLAATPEAAIQRTSRHQSTAVLRGYDRSGRWTATPSSRSMWSA